MTQDLRFRNSKNKTLFLFLVFLLSTFYFLSSTSSSATQSQVLITWQAQGFVPAGYQGKILPSPGTTVKVGLELLKENKLQNLSKTDILWYLDGKLFTRGQGLKEINFSTTKGATYSHFVRAVINYQQQEFAGTVDVPIVNPKIVIKTPYPTDFSIPLGETLIQAIPYFFNVDNLEEIFFNWTVNERTIPGTNPLIKLELSPPIPLNHNINVKVTAKNLKNDLEFGFKEINLNVQQ